MIAWRRIGILTFLGAASAVVLAILAFYAKRLAVPLPLFAADEAAYLVRALYPDDLVAQNPYVATAANGVHLSVIRAVVMAGGSMVRGDREVNLAVYLLGLVSLWWASVKRTKVETPGEMGLALLLLALGFSYYRFAATNLAEGLFVGTFVAFALSTRAGWRTRPIAQAALAGALAAILVLVKPNGVAEIGALAGVAVLDAWTARDWKRLPLRAAVFALVFFALGNLIQWLAEEPAANPWAFFVSRDYNALIGSVPAKAGPVLGLLGLLAMTSASAVMAGAPAVVGLADLWSRRRAAEGRQFEADGGDRVFLLTLGSLIGTIAMVAVFTMKVASAPGETLRLWGRYFEFFVPLLWLAAAPSLARGVRPATMAACAVVTFVGLAGLLVSFRAGIVLLPWDSSVLTAFFQPDPVRAPMAFPLPFRALAILTTLLAGAAYAARLKPTLVGLGLLLVLSGLSTVQDAYWLTPLARARKALSHDLAAIAPRLPPAGVVDFLSSDVNDTHLAFLVLQTRPHVIVGPPGQAPAADLARAAAAIVAGPETPPSGPWKPVFHGEILTLYARPAAS